jgi:hypothetical protein
MNSALHHKSACFFVSEIESGQILPRSRKIVAA